MAKTEKLSFRIEPEFKEAFDKLCEDSFTTSSHKLYLYVRQQIKHSQSKRISLQEFKERKS